MSGLGGTNAPHPCGEVLHGPAGRGPSGGGSASRPGYPTPGQVGPKGDRSRHHGGDPEGCLDLIWAVDRFRKTEIREVAPEWYQDPWVDCDMDRFRSRFSVQAQLAILVRCLKWCGFGRIKGTPKSKIPPPPHVVPHRWTPGGSIPVG